MSGPRVLILSADIGAGHDLPAELLKAGIFEREPAALVGITDGVRAMGRVNHRLVRGGQETVLAHLRAVFEAQYFLISAYPPSRRVLSAIGYRLGGPPIERLLERAAPDVVVSTYPGTTELLGRLRTDGRIAVPCVSAITDLAALVFWANPGIDRHLVIHAESAAEVRAIAGPDADVRHVRGLVRPAFEDPPSRAEARAALGLPAEPPVVVVSGGGWGVGDLASATREVLRIPGALAVCLCGTSPGVRERLEREFAGEPRVRLEGFTDRMPEFLAAADALVHSTAGLTMLEAQLCGTWAISYGWGAGHVRINDAAYRRFGLAKVAATPTELARELRDALATPRPRDPGYARLPSAADAVLDLVAAR